MFPRIDLRINVSFVDAGKVLTSEGGARSYDVAMHLVDKLYGPKVAQGVGHGLLIPWPPAPGTLKFDTAVPVPPPPTVATPAPAQALEEEKGRQDGRDEGGVPPPVVRQELRTGRRAEAEDRGLSLSLDSKKRPRLALRSRCRT